MRREHTKATLMSWSKEKLADYIIMLERNNNELHETIDRQYYNCMHMIDDMNILNECYKEGEKL